MALPPRGDLIGPRVQRPREDVDGTGEEKGVLRIIQWRVEVVDIEVPDFPKDFITTAKMRGGREGTLLSSRYFESGEWIRPGAEGACGCAVACRVGKVRRPLEGGVHCIEASVGACGESVGEEPRC